MAKHRGKKYQDALKKVDSKKAPSIAYFLHRYIHLWQNFGWGGEICCEKGASKKSAPYVKIVALWRGKGGVYNNARTKTRQRNAAVRRSAA